MDYKARNWITKLVIAITSKFLVTSLVTRLVMLECVGATMSEDGRWRKASLLKVLCILSKD